MKEFRSLEDVDGMQLSPETARLVRRTLQTLIDAYAEVGDLYDPNVDGHTVLIEKHDTDDAIRCAIGGQTLRDALFEGVTYEDGHFITCLLFNNQFGISIVIPDAPWLDLAVRERLMSGL